jgi:hypothetical protein
MRYAAHRLNHRTDAGFVLRSLPSGDLAVNQRDDTDVDWVTHIIFASVQ